MEPAQSFSQFRPARPASIVGHRRRSRPSGFSSFRPSVRYIRSIRPNSLILWDAGDNRHRHKMVSESEYLRRFDLVGIREYGQGYERVALGLKVRACLGF